MIAKSRTEVEHVEHLLKLFQRLRKYKLRLNPSKCTFGVRSGKLLGFIVSERGIEVDYAKVKAIQEMLVPKTEKQVRGKGLEYATKIKDATITLYKKCAEYALSKGIIIADTKFEFGLDENGEVVIGDEMLTPDSSRFWPLEGYEAGKSQPSYDKQFVRDWLKANPDSDYLLPDDVIEKTVEKYKEAYKLLTGKDFSRK